MKQTVNRDVVSSNNQKINFGSLFLGEVALTPEIVNPTREEFIELKGLQNIEDQIQEQNYLDIEINNKTVTKVEFYFSFNPNEMLGIDEDSGSKEKYEDKVVVSIPVFISKEKTRSASGKIQVIDQHNQSWWIPEKPELTVAEMVKDYLNETVENNGKSYVISVLQSLDLESVRHAYRGEVDLYNVIFEHTVLPPHNVKKVKNDKGELVPYPLNNFVLGGDIDPEKASAEFLKVVAGDVSYIREVMNDDICKHANGEKSRVWGLLGVRERNGKFYQELYAANNECTISSDTSVPRERGNHGPTYLNKGAYEKLINEEYPWRSYWGNSLKFRVFNEDAYNSQKEGVDNSISGNDDDDDLPF